MSDAEFYILWATPLLALLVNKGSWRYVVSIMAFSLCFDIASEPLSDDGYFLCAAIHDLACIWLLKEMAVFFSMSFSINLFQFLDGSVYQQTGSHIHFYILTAVQLYCLTRIRGEDVGGIGSIHQSHGGNKFGFFSNKRIV
jgi:hypothetical protein